MSIARKTLDQGEQMLMRTIRERIRRRWKMIALCVVGMSVGCAHSRTDVTYLTDPNVSYYRGHATDIDFPAVDCVHPPEVTNTTPPVTVRELESLPVRDLPLSEAIQTALSNSEIIRSAGTFLSLGNSIYTNPDRIPSTFDPAIQESGVLFGGRGVEAALAAFDTQLQASMIWGRNETPQNNAFFGGGVGGGGALIQESGTFTSSLAKSFANGGSVNISHNVNYLGTNSPSLFQSAYSGNLQFQYQHPLLAGSGTEFTRIAGPIGQSFGGISGVSQGVVIARINNDITLADFESSVRNLVKDVEDAYWDLYLAYQTYETAVLAHTQTLRVTDYTAARAGVVAGTTLADRFRAESQLLGTEAEAIAARSQIYEAEVRLRRLMGLPTSDGSVIRPLDTPVTVELIPDWYNSLTEALSQRVELRRQKWNIKSLELQLRAAESLTRPRLDFVSGYQVNSLGDNLFGYNEPLLGNYYETLLGGNYTGWNLGLQMRWDIGFRQAKAQVQNYELRLAKAQRVLLEQEEEISHELANAFQELARTYRIAQQNYTRLLAAEREVELRSRTQDDQGIPENAGDLDRHLDAIVRRAQSQAAYYQNLIAYNKAITNYHLRKGALLRHNSILLAEGGWEAGAYEDAKAHSDARLHAKPAKRLWQEPEAFASEYPVGNVSVHQASSTADEVPAMPIDEDADSQPTPADKATDANEIPAAPPVPAAEREPLLQPVPKPNLTSPEPLRQPQVRKPQELNPKRPTAPAPPVELAPSAIRPIFGESTSWNVSDSPGD